MSPNTCCIVHRCRRRGGYRFPLDGDLKSSWLKAIKWAIPLEPKKTAVVCPTHFAQDDFETNVVDGVLRNYLKTDAVPSIFPWNSDLWGNQESSTESSDDEELSSAASFGSDLEEEIIDLSDAEKVDSSAEQHVSVETQDSLQGINPIAGTQNSRLGITPSAETQDSRQGITPSGETQDSQQGTTASAETQESQQEFTPSAETRESRQGTTPSAETQDNQQGITPSAETRDSRQGTTPHAETHDNQQGISPSAENQDSREGITPSVGTQDSQQGISPSAETQDSQEGIIPSAETQDSREGITTSAETQDSQQGISSSAETQDTREGITPSAETQDSRQGISPSAETQVTREGITPGAETQDSRQGISPSAMTQDTRERITPGAETQDSRQGITPSAETQHSREAITPSDVTNGDSSNVGHSSENRSSSEDSTTSDDETSSGSSSASSGSISKPDESATGDNSSPESCPSQPSPEQKKKRSGRKSKPRNKSATAPDIESKEIPNVTKKRPNVTRFTKEQTTKLGQLFEENQYPDRNQKEEICRSLGLRDPAVVKNWFQNRRALARKVREITGKEDSEGKEDNEAPSGEVPSETPAHPADKDDGDNGDNENQERCSSGSSSKSDASSETPAHPADKDDDGNNDAGDNEDDRGDKDEGDNEHEELCSSGSSSKSDASSDTPAHPADIGERDSDDDGDTEDDSDNNGDGENENEVLHSPAGSSKSDAETQQRLQKLWMYYGTQGCDIPQGPVLEEIASECGLSREATKRWFEYAKRRFSSSKYKKNNTNKLLLKKFIHSCYPSDEDVDCMSYTTGLSPEEIHNWFRTERYWQTMYFNDDEGNKTSQEENPDLLPQPVNRKRKEAPDSLPSEESNTSPAFEVSSQNNDQSQNGDDTEIESMSVYGEDAPGIDLTRENDTESPQPKPSSPLWSDSGSSVDISLPNLESGSNNRVVLQHWVDKLLKRRKYCHTEPISEEEAEEEEKEDDVDNVDFVDLVTDSPEVQTNNGSDKVAPKGKEDDAAHSSSSDCEIIEPEHPLIEIDSDDDLPSQPPTVVRRGTGRPPNIPAKKISAVPRPRKQTLVPKRGSSPQFSGKSNQDVFCVYLSPTSPKCYLPSITDSLEAEQWDRLLKRLGPLKTGSIIKTATNEAYKVVAVRSSQDTSYVTKMVLAKVKDQQSKQPGRDTKILRKVANPPGQVVQARNNQSEPGKNSDYAKVLVAAHPPAKVAAQAPVKVAAHAPVKVAAHAPARVAAHPPAKVAAHPPAKVAAHPPAKVAAHPPAKVAAHPPAKVAAHPPAKVAAHPPAKIAAYPPAKRRKTDSSHEQVGNEAQPNSGDIIQVEPSSDVIVLPKLIPTRKLADQPTTSHTNLRIVQPHTVVNRTGKPLTYPGAAQVRCNVKEPTESASRTGITSSKAVDEQMDTSAPQAEANGKKAAEQSGPKPVIVCDRTVEPRAALKKASLFISPNSQIKQPAGYQKQPLIFKGIVNSQNGQKIAIIQPSRVQQSEQRGVNPAGNQASPGMPQTSKTQALRPILIGHKPPSPVIQTTPQSAGTVQTIGREVFSCYVNLVPEEDHLCTEHNSSKSVVKLKTVFGFEGHCNFLESKFQKIDFSDRPLYKYKTMFLPDMQHGLIYWGHCPGAKRIFNLQKSVIGKIFGAETVIPRHFSTLKLLTMPSTYVLQCLVHVHKSHDEVQARVQEIKALKALDPTNPLPNIPHYELNGFILYKALPSEMHHMRLDVFTACLKVFLHKNPIFSIGAYFEAVKSLGSNANSPQTTPEAAQHPCNAVN